MHTHMHAHMHTRRMLARTRAGACTQKHLRPPPSTPLAKPQHTLLHVLCAPPPSDCYFPLTACPSPPPSDQDVRSGSNVCFELQKSEVLTREPLESDLAVKEKTDVYKLAGAIAGRVRDGEEVAVTTKGPIPVLVAVKAIATAQEYLADDNIEIKFCVSIVDLENPEIRDATSTYLHFALVPFN